MLGVKFALIMANKSKHLVEIRCTTCLPNNWVFEIIFQDKVIQEVRDNPDDYTAAETLYMLSIFRDAGMLDLKTDSNTQKFLDGPGKISR